MQRRQTGVERGGRERDGLEELQAGEHCGYEEGVNLFVPKVYPRLELFPWERSPEMKL